MPYTTYADYGEDRVRLTWVSSGELPPADLITSVHGLCFYQGKLVLVKLERGFDIPGGHLEPGESPVDCMRRELFEEACAWGSACTLLGHLEVSHEENPNWKPGGRYPQVGYQVFYRVEVSKLLPFRAEFESSERVLADVTAGSEIWHGWSGLGRMILEEAVSVKRLYVVRHCKAEGQPAEAPLTAEGFEQAATLAGFFHDVGVERIVASPFLRTRQTAAPLAEGLGLPVDADDRLVERRLASGVLPDWLDRLKATFADLDLAYEGGESSREAMNRAVAAANDALAGANTTTVIVTHGNLAALLLKHFDERVGFEDWRRMTNPDVYLVTIATWGTAVERVWAQ